MYHPSNQEQNPESMNQNQEGSIVFERKQQQQRDRYIFQRIRLRCHRSLQFSIAAITYAYLLCPPYLDHI
jgi:hypothetical protein